MSDNPFANLTDDAPSAPRTTRSPSRRPKGKKVRHGFASFWLVLLMVVHTAVIVLMVCGAAGIGLVIDDQFTVVWGVATSTVSLVSLVLLWNFQKIGFFGMVAVTVANTAVSVYTAESAPEYGGLAPAFAGLAVLYGVLQIGKPNTWEQLT